MRLALLVLLGLLWAGPAWGQVAWRTCTATHQAGTIVSPTISPFQNPICFDFNDSNSTYALAPTTGAGDVVQQVGCNSVDVLFDADLLVAGNPTGAAVDVRICTAKQSTTPDTACPILDNLAGTDAGGGAENLEPGLTSTWIMVSITTAAPASDDARVMLVCRP